MFSPDVYTASFGGMYSRQSRGTGLY